MILALVVLAVLTAGSLPPLPDSIGVATMSADGTITLRLRAESDDGKTVGDGQLIYRPGDPKYGEVLRHLGGLKPGESKSVPPWP